MLRSNASNAERPKRKCVTPSNTEPENRPNVADRCAVSISLSGNPGRVIIYAIKQVAPVIKEESQEIVVITVYTFYF